MTTNAFRHAEMVGSDKRMDQRGNFDLPVNPLPVRCPRCTFPDLDYIPQPYFLAKGTKDPSDMALAEVGNFFVRERGRRVVELVAPDECRFYPTHDLKTKALTPWFLAVPNTLIRTATVRPSIPRCPECGEPKVAHPGSHYEYPSVSDRERIDVLAASAAKMAGPVPQDIFKSLNWSSAESIGEDSRWYFMHVLGWEKRQKTPEYQWTRIVLGRELYFSVRLGALLKRLGMQGLVPLVACKEKPTPEELVWVAEKCRLLAEQGLAATASGRPAPDVIKWFQRYLKKHAAAAPASYDWNRWQSDLGLPLPDSYKAFISTIGRKTFQDVDEEEGFTVHILTPDQLDAQAYRTGSDLVEDADGVDGVMFATTDHGDCLCFDAGKNAPDYPVYFYNHEMMAFEPYTRDFMECVQRLAGE